MRKVHRLLIVTALIATAFCIGGAAWAATDYGFIQGESWMPPRTTAVELGSLTIEIDPMVEGEHSALFMLPDQFKVELPGDISSLQDPLVIFTAVSLSDREFLGKINAPAGHSKHTFIVPIRSTIPSGAKGDIELKITHLSGQLVNGLVAAGAALPGELTIQSSRVGTIKDGKSAVQLTFTENMAGLLSKSSPIKLTLPEGFEWSGARGERVSGASLDVRTVIDKRVLELRVNLESTQRSAYRVDAEVRLVNEARAQTGEVRAKIEGLRSLSSQTVLVAHYQAPVPAQPKELAVFTVGSTAYTYAQQPRQMDVAPYMRDGRVFIPLRFVAASLGLESLTWDGSAAIMIKEGRTVKVVPGSRSMWVNGQSSAMEIAPEIVAPGRLMLPYRFIAEAFGAEVRWDSAKETVSVY